MAKKKQTTKSPIQELLEEVEGIADYLVHADASTMEMYLREMGDDEVERLRKCVNDITDLLSK